MLDTNRILNIEMDTDEWIRLRLARFTSSEIHNLMGEKENTRGSLNYIYRKVGEELTGMPQKDNIENEATLHGKIYEQEALRKYSQKFNIPYLSTQRMVVGVNEKFSSTPDALEIISKKENGEYSVTTIEVKCPLTYDNYIRLALCETPQEVKKEYSNYYWQVIDQIDNCSALRGKLIVYHPNFSVGNLKVIDFKIMDKISGEYLLKNDLNLLKERKNKALIKFYEIKDKISNIK